MCLGDDALSRVSCLFLHNISERKYILRSLNNVGKAILEGEGGGGGVWGTPYVLLLPAGD